MERTGTILRDAEPEPPTPNAQSKAWAKDMPHKNRETRKKIGNLSLAPARRADTNNFWFSELDEASAHW